MEEIVKRLLRERFLAGELLVSALLSNILALASSLYVMQVLNRYVSNGVDSTLITLTTGTLIAIGLEFGFRQVRHNLVSEINQKPNEEIALSIFSVLTRAQMFSLSQIDTGKRREIVNGVNEVESAFTPSNINTILDVPFSIVFLIVLAMFSWVLAFVTVLFIAFIMFHTMVKSSTIRDATQEMKSGSAQTGSIVETANREIETVRSFNAALYLKEKWLEKTDGVNDLREQIGSHQGLIQTVTQSATAIMSALVIAFGAMLVVSGDLDSGMLIACNILATRALQPFSRFAGLRTAFEKSENAMELLEEFVKLPLEPERGSAKKQYSGAIEFRDVAFFYPGSSTPLFESLNVDLNAGSLVFVVGESGTGKTTMAKMLSGLMAPVRGQILIDGLDLRQVVPEWWRKQIVYFPQEPSFLNASIEDNLRTLDPDMTNERLNEVVNQAGLRTFIDETPEGLETMIVDNGRQLAVGIRRQLALARALTTNGKLVVFDEMFDGLDSDGRAAVNQVLNQFVHEGRTVFLMSHKASKDDAIHAVIDLNPKPKPRVTIFSAAYPSGAGHRAPSEEEIAARDREDL